MNAPDAYIPPELLGRVKERVLEGQHHQDIPFEQVVDLVNPVRSLSHNPLFQVAFAWQNEARGVSLPGLVLNVGGAGASDVPAMFDLVLELAERDGRVQGVAAFGHIRGEVRERRRESLLHRCPARVRPAFRPALRSG